MTSEERDAGFGSDASSETKATEHILLLLYCLARNARRNPSSALACRMGAHSNAPRPRLRTVHPSSKTEFDAPLGKPLPPLVKRISGAKNSRRCLTDGSLFKPGSAAMAPSHVFNKKGGGVLLRRSRRISRSANFLTRRGIVVQSCRVLAKNPVR
jgi:hypothetical protein